MCSECGCKVTAEHQKGFTYYRCTKGKGRDKCSQRKYTREELLLAQFDSILGLIEISPEIVEMLVRDSRALDQYSEQETVSECTQIERLLTELDAKASKLLDSYLEGVVPVEAYRAKADEIAEQRRGFERRLTALSGSPQGKTSQVERLAKQAGARAQFGKADTEGKRRLLDAVLLNAERSRMAKSPPTS